MDKTKETDEIANGSMAADTIKPKGDAKEVTPTKLGLMAGVMNAMAGMSQEDLNGFMASMAQYGAGKEWGIPSGAAAHNASTIQMKPSAASAMKEDLTVMFDGEELSEEFKGKVSTLFEAAVEARLATEVVRLQEEFEQNLAEQLEAFSEDVTSKLDSYLDYVVENWMEENEVAINSALEAELSKDFIAGLKNLFSEHYINVPEEKIDVLESLAEKNQILESKIDEILEENHELRLALVEEAAHNIVEELSSDLALTQKEKFVKMAEGIEFDGDVEVFEEKLKVIKESYFGNNEKRTESNILEESFEGEIETGAKNIDPNVDRYVQAIAKTIKK